MTELEMDYGLSYALKGVRGKLIRAIGQSLARERERWVLWIPVALGVGIGVYFSLTFEPSRFLGLAVLLACAAGFLLTRLLSHQQRSILIPVFLTVALVAGGFALAQIQTSRAAGTALNHPLGVVSVEGRIEDWDVTDEGARVTLTPMAITGVHGLPRLIRITLRHPTDAWRIGDMMTLKASLMPPPGPAMPGGFDYQRQAYFAGIGAVGYAVGGIELVPAPMRGVATWLRDCRIKIAARIRDQLPGPGGAVAAALVTGERGAIPADTNEAYRNSGLAHLLVIAGLHMTLVTGFVFFAIRAVLALIPSLALRYPIKKWAAGAALLVAMIYLVLSGAAVPTQRAFVMVTMGLVAILLDRWSVSMRAVAWAATFVLVTDPAALTGVSFQMSFAAVVGLVAFYETFGQRLSIGHPDAGILRHGLNHAGGVILTTIVATLATSAFSIYHFNRFALFSVLANVVAVPLAGIWVLPWAFAACVLMPFGGERLALIPLGWGLDLIGAVAKWTSTLPAATVDLPTMPFWGFVAFVAGGLWLALWRGRWRQAGLAGILLGIASFAMLRSPDILLSEDGRLVAAKLSDGYFLSSDHTARADRESWLRVTGTAMAGLFPASGNERLELRCDPDSCLWRRPNGIVAFVRSRAALEEDCANAGLVISSVPVPRSCRQMTRVLDSTDLRRGGATAIWFGPDLTIRTANATRGSRPWVRQEQPRATSSAGVVLPTGPVP